MELGVTDCVARQAATPLAASEGATLAIHDRESEWHGWIWCVTAAGTGGWVPEAWVERHGDGTCTLLRDYTARELTVRAGERVTASLTESGWAWVTNEAASSGWVPLAHLAPA
jgi:hypothetical protein